MFGDLVKDVPAGNQSGIDATLKAGTKDQRKYARKFCKSTMREGTKGRATAQAATGVLP